MMLKTLLVAGKISRKENYLDFMRITVKEFAGAS